MVAPSISGNMSYGLGRAGGECRREQTMNGVIAKGIKMQRQWTARQVFHGSNGGVTRSYCRQLEGLGQQGRIAAQLFRTQKASRRAKQYRGGVRQSNGRFVSYRELAYERKGECLEVLCDLLSEDSRGIAWGWKGDSNVRVAPHVLYVDLPQGQVSFHSELQYSGPVYSGDWDKTHASEQRILDFCDSVSGVATPERQVAANVETMS